MNKLQQRRKQHLLNRIEQAQLSTQDQILLNALEFGRLCVLESYPVSNSHMMIDCECPYCHEHHDVELATLYNVKSTYNKKCKMLATGGYNTEAQKQGRLKVIADVNAYLSEHPEVRHDIAMAGVEAHNNNGTRYVFSDEDRLKAQQVLHGQQEQDSSL